MNTKTGLIKLINTEINKARSLKVNEIKNYNKFLEIKSITSYITKLKALKKEELKNMYVELKTCVA